MCYLLFDSMTQTDKHQHSKYLTSSEQDASWGIRINTVGYQRVEAGEHYPLPDHPSRYLFSSAKGRVLEEYQLLYISSGKGHFASASVERTKITQGTMFLLFPHEWHNYSPDSDCGWDEYWIGFEGGDMEKYRQNGFFDPARPIFNIGVRSNVVELYREAIRVAQEQQPGYQQLLGGIVHHLLGEAYSDHKRSGFEDVAIVDKINQAKIIITERFASALSPREVAAEVGMSYSWFRRLFHQYTGLTPIKFIQEIRMREAMHMLTHTDKRIKEVAFCCGYGNVEHFCTAFKHKTGYTPEGYRHFTQGRHL